MPCRISVGPGAFTWDGRAAEGLLDVAGNSRRRRTQFRSPPRAIYAFAMPFQQE